MPLLVRPLLPLLHRPISAHALLAFSLLARLPGTVIPPFLPAFLALLFPLSFRLLLPFSLLARLPGTVIPPFFSARSFETNLSLRVAYQRQPWRHDMIECTQRHPLMYCHGGADARRAGRLGWSTFTSTITRARTTPRTPSAPTSTGARRSSQETLKRFS